MKYSAEEDQVIRAMYPTNPGTKVAETLGRDVKSVQNRARLLGVPGKDIWRPNEIAALRAAYTSLDGPIALNMLEKLLGRFRSNICRKARALGLTNQHRTKSEDHRRQDSENTKKWIQERGHPRGALGMKHTDETKAVIASKSRLMWADPNSKLNTPEMAQRRSDAMSARQASGQLRNGFTRCAGGRREDVGDMYFRSSWEANYARYLNWRKARGDLATWEYEPKTFTFDKIKRGTRSYTPDFLVCFMGGRHEWHEVKGWMDPASVTRLKRMAEFFPEEKVLVIGDQWFKMARRSGIASMLPNWETGARKCRNR